MKYCDLHEVSIDRRGCPWCLIEDLESKITNLTKQNNRYREALERIVRVNAMDYEYVRWAREALQKEIT